jgi:hypothetical protein
MHEADIRSFAGRDWAAIDLQPAFEAELARAQR